MTHARQQIREAAATLLKTSPSAWGQVFETRLPSARAVMPYLMLFCDGEQVEAATVHAPDIYLREASLIVAGRLRLPGNNDLETVEDRMDALAAEVESKLRFAALVAAVPLLHALRLVASDMTVVTDEQDAPQYAEITLQYLAAYATQEGVAETLI